MEPTRYSYVFPAEGFRAATLLEEWQAGCASPDPGLVSVHPTSDLAGDAVGTGIWNMQSDVSRLLSSAIDCLHCFRTAFLPLDEGDEFVSRPNAPYPLLREGLVGAATVMWLMKPDDRKTRQNRLLGMWTGDIKGREDIMLSLEPIAVREAPLPPKKNRNRLSFEQARQQEVRAIATGDRRERFLVAGGGKAPEATSATKMLRKVEAECGLERLEFTWRLLSALAHGEPWAYYSLLNIEGFDETASDELAPMRVTSNPDTLVQLFLYSFSRLEDAIGLARMRGLPLLNGVTPGRATD